MTRLSAPCSRDRRKRKIARYSQQARDWFTVIAGAALIAMALVTLVLLAVVLAGCTAVGYERRAAATAAARGCYCSGSNCEKIESAAGQAAVAAAGGQVVNITEIRKSEEDIE